MENYEEARLERDRLIRAVIRLSPTKADAEANAGSISEMMREVLRLTDIMHAAGTVDAYRP